MPSSAWKKKTQNKKPDLPKVSKEKNKKTGPESQKLGKRKEKKAPAGKSYKFFFSAPQEHWRIAGRSQKLAKKKHPPES